MGGKNYFCDYCGCFMKNDTNVRKLHNSGIAHQIAKVRCLRPFEDAWKVYEAEMTKVPCSRFQKGYCKFDLFCHFGHYSAKQLQQLQKIAERQAKKLKSQSKRQLKQKSLFEHVMPWNLEPTRICQRKRRQKNLPASLQPIELSLLNDTHLDTEWG